MGIEIERKYLVESDTWRDASFGTTIQQAYLSLDKRRTVRVRIAGNEGILTINGPTQDISRLEITLFPRLMQRLYWTYVSDR